jgi:hypothetical protein
MRIHPPKVSPVAATDTKEPKITTKTKIRGRDEAKPRSVKAAMALKRAEKSITCTYGILSHM